jgi:hypothetical protein
MRTPPSSTSISFKSWRRSTSASASTRASMPVGAFDDDPDERDDDPDTDASPRDGAGFFPLALIGFASESRRPTGRRFSTI